METSAQFLALVLVLTVAAKVAVGWLKVAAKRWLTLDIQAGQTQSLAVAVGVALLTLAWAVAKYLPDVGGPDLAFLAAQPLLAVLIAGVMAGLGSSGAHDAWKRATASPKVP